MKWLNEVVGYVFGHSITGMILNIAWAILPISVLEKWKELGKESLTNAVIDWMYLVTFMLLYPNTLYLMTEIRHFFKPGDLVAEDQSAGSFVFLASVSFFGLFLTITTMLKAIREIEFLKRNAPANIALIYLVSSFGMGLGLYQRINWYDAILTPGKVFAAAITLVQSPVEMGVLSGIALLLTLATLFFHKK